MAWPQYIPHGPSARRDSEWWLNMMKELDQSMDAREQEREQDYDHERDREWERERGYRDFERFRDTDREGICQSPSGKGYWVEVWYRWVEVVLSTLDWYLLCGCGCGGFIFYVIFSPYSSCFLSLLLTIFFLSFSPSPIFWVLSGFPVSLALVFFSLVSLYRVSVFVILFVVALCLWVIFHITFSPNWTRYAIFNGSLLIARRLIIGLFRWR